LPKGPIVNDLSRKRRRQLMVVDDSTAKCRGGGGGRRRVDKDLIPSRRSEK
jgi:hypothetical protein